MGVKGQQEPSDFLYGFDFHCLIFVISSFQFFFYFQLFTFFDIQIL